VCNFIQRWWHRRLREIDVITLLPTFQLKVLQQIESGKKLDLDSTVDKMFDLHKSLPGQEHWNCKCSRGE
jgi:hypothetical protein